MKERINMDVHISISTRSTDIILEEGMERISQTAKDNPQWEKHEDYDSYEIECNISEEDILSIFDALITKYPESKLYASYSYSLREDDRSAQWWRTTNIKTEHHPDGTATLYTDSYTNWF